MNSSSRKNKCTTTTQHCCYSLNTNLLLTTRYYCRKNRICWSVGFERTNQFYWVLSRDVSQIRRRYTNIMGVYIRILIISLSWFAINRRSSVKCWGHFELLIPSQHGIALKAINGLIRWYYRDVESHNYWRTQKAPPFSHMTSKCRWKSYLERSSFLIDLVQIAFRAFVFGDDVTEHILAEV